MLKSLRTSIPKIRQLVGFAAGRGRRAHLGRLGGVDTRRMLAGLYVQCQVYIFGGGSGMLGAAASAGAGSCGAGCCGAGAATSGAGAGASSFFPQAVSPARNIMASKATFLRFEKRITYPLPSVCFLRMYYIIQDS
jgi:hypothetical protein